MEFALPDFLLPQTDVSDVVPPATVCLPLSAGDVVVFSTNLFHDAAAWTEDYPRINVFQRFTLASYFGEFGPDNSEHHHRLGSECAELEMGSYTDEEPMAVQQMRSWWAAKVGQPMLPHRLPIEHTFPKL